MSLALSRFVEETKRQSNNQIVLPDVSFMSRAPRELVELHSRLKVLYSLVMDPDKTDHQIEMLTRPKSGNLSQDNAFEAIKEIWMNVRRQQRIGWDTKAKGVVALFDEEAELHKERERKLQELEQHLSKVSHFKPFAVKHVNFERNNPFGLLYPNEHFSEVETRIRQSIEEEAGPSSAGYLFPRQS